MKLHISVNCIQSFIDIDYIFWQTDSFETKEANSTALYIS